MGATNSTLNYQLSQFISTDKPAWLQDYNGDMEKIDVGINTAKVAADTAQNTANSAISSIGTVSSDISALQTDVLAHTNDITDLQGDVNTIESLIGNGTPTAGDHTLIGAINTNTSSITNLSSALSNKIIVISASHTWNGTAASYDNSELLTALQNGYKLISVVNNYGTSSSTVYGESYLLPVFRVPTSQDSIIVAGSDGAAYNQVILLDFVFLKI